MSEIVISMLWGVLWILLLGSEGVMVGCALIFVGTVIFSLRWIFLLDWKSRHSVCPVVYSISCEMGGV